MSVVKGEYSICTAVIGCMACARRRVEEEISERPRWVILPLLFFMKRGRVKVSPMSALYMQSRGLSIVESEGGGKNKSNELISQIKKLPKLTSSIPPSP